MESHEIEEIKNKTTTSIIFLTLRNFGIQAVSLVGFFILSVLLGAGEIGLFSIVAESVGILGYFSDVGLAPTLIQQKETPTRKQLRTAFTIQQFLVIIALITVSLVFSRFSLAKNYGGKETWIMISLCFSFMAASLKTIPSLLLERELDFKLLSTVDILENITFYVFAVIFAVLGFGAYSYAIATFVRSSLGLIIIYRLSPWDIGFSLSWTTTKDLFRYGIPFQINSFIALAKDRVSSLLVAGIIGRESFGLLSWAQKGPRIPLNFMDAIMKVTFPTFSRIQDDKLLLSKSIDRSLFFIALFVFPSLAGLCLISPEIVLLIPKYTKWEPALLPMYLLAFNAAIAAVTTPLTNAFNAIGKISLTTKFMIMWTILTWIFFPSLSVIYGYRGTAVANLLVGLSSFIVWIYASKIFSVNIFATIIHPTLATLILVAVGLSISHLGLPPLGLVFLKILAGITVYALYHYFYSLDKINWFIQQIKWSRDKK